MKILLGKIKQVLFKTPEKVFHEKQEASAPVDPSVDTHVQEVSTDDLIPGEEISSIGLPMINQKLLNTLSLGSQDLEPGQSGPDTVFLADVV